MSPHAEVGRTSAPCSELMAVSIAASFPALAQGPSLAQRERQIASSYDITLASDLEIQAFKCGLNRS